MNSIYTTTITNEAKRRGIRIAVIEPATPIFKLQHKGRSIRCFNALTDQVGAVSFLMAQDKQLAHTCLAQSGFPVPAQIKFTAWPEAAAFLKQQRSIVVKPCREWGGRGVSVDVRTDPELKRALAQARRFSEDIILEACVSGEDFRVIIVNGRLAAAIRRDPARVFGNGQDTIRTLIRRKNALAKKTDPSHRIPLDEETRRALRFFGFDYDSVPKNGAWVQVRRTSNYHTGGTVEVVTDTVDRMLVNEAKRVARWFGIPVMGVDFLVNPATGQRWIIELSPDLAISPPEGERVAKFFLDYLFPQTARRA